MGHVTRGSQGEGEVSPTPTLRLQVWRAGGLTRGFQLETDGDLVPAPGWLGGGLGGQCPVACGGLCAGFRDKPHQAPGSQCWLQSRRVGAIALGSGSSGQPPIPSTIPGPACCPAPQTAPSSGWRLQRGDVERRPCVPRVWSSDPAAALSGWAGGQPAPRTRRPLAWPAGAGPVWGMNGV